MRISDWSSDVCSSDLEDVGRVASHGGQIIVSPSTDAEVIEATVEAGLVSAPGYFTPSEAFLAIRAGAHALKLFPAEAASPKVVKAIRAVWPSHIPQIVIGGVTPDTMADYIADRKSVVQGKMVAVRVTVGGRRIIKKKKKQ